MSRNLKVGLFVLFGIVLLTGIVFAIGDSRRFWDPKVHFTTSFGDVSGLKIGAPVRMGGVDVGTVTHVGHNDATADARIYVGLSVVRSEAARIRTDCIARVTNKGLLGDKMIEISVSTTPGAPELDPSIPIKSEDPTDFGKYIARLDGITASAQAALENVEKATEPFKNPQFAQDVQGTVHSLNDLLDGVAHKDGAVHRLVFDTKEADRVSQLIANLDQSTAMLNATLADAHDVAGQVKTGPGLAHSLLYDGEVSENTAGILHELHRDLAAVREGNGLAHSLVYGDDSSQHVMGNVNAMSDDLRAIVANVRAGKGTIGALLVDPSVYEDIKMLVGNVERNEVLRSLVRYSIKADEEKPTVEVKKAP
jgi:phospholipid/cholesterol/gamma-HCH transport system substrate-binding protein